MLYEKNSTAQTGKN